jgi:hypothetical protein
MHINDVCHLLAPQLLEECGNAFRWGLATPHLMPCPGVLHLSVSTVNPAPC